jgi:mannose PTS system EIIA component
MSTQNGHLTKLIVVGHSPLASALLAVHVHGTVPAHVMAIDVAANETPESTQLRIAQAIKQSPALVLCDLVGATPHNCATKACGDQHQALILSPVSAPLLLRAVNYSHLPPQALYDKLTAS